MRIEVRPAVLAGVGLAVALLVGIRSPPWGFRLLAVLAIVLLLRLVAGSRGRR